MNKTIPTPILIAIIVVVLVIVIGAGLWRSARPAQPPFPASNANVSRGAPAPMSGAPGPMGGVPLPTPPSNPH